MDTTTTVTPAADVGRARPILRQPIGWPTIAISATLAACTLWMFSLPGGPSMGVFASMTLAWLGVGGYWLIRLVVASLAGGFRPVRDAWGRWVAPVIVVAVTAGLLVTSAPLLLRFNLSQREMDQLARDADGTSQRLKVDRIGFFPVRRVERFEGGVRFVVNECMVDMCGFAYSSRGRPPNLGGEDSYYHLEGNWFLWEESW